MQTISDSELTNFMQRLIPLTYFRRNAGEVLKRLPQVGTYILTKGGKPVAKLSQMKEISPAGKENIKANIEKVRRFAGRFKLGNITPKQINKIIEQSYGKVLS